MKFRLPRKIKKKLRKEHLFYPPEEDGSRLVANPVESQKEYDLYKKGFFENPFIITKKQTKAYREKLFSPIDMMESELIVAISYIFSEKYRVSSLITLLKASRHNEAKKYYYAFINAYNLTINGESYGNTCCMAVDSAKEKMKKK